MIFIVSTVRACGTYIKCNVGLFWPDPFVWCDKKDIIIIVYYRSLIEFQCYFLKPLVAL